MIRGDRTEQPGNKTKKGEHVVANDAGDRPGVNRVFPVR